MLHRDASFSHVPHRTIIPSRAREAARLLLQCRNLLPLQCPNPVQPLDAQPAQHMKDKECVCGGRGGHSMAGGVGPGRGECVTWAVSHISPATYQCRCSDPRQAPLPGGSSRIRQGRNACRAPSTGAAGGLSQLSPPPLLDPLFGWPGPAIRPTSWQRGPRVKRLSRGRQNPTPQVRRRERRVTIS